MTTGNFWRVVNLNDIDIIKNNGERKANENFTNILNSLKTFDQIIQAIRKQQLKNKVPDDKKEIYKKAEQEWKKINNLVDEYDGLLPDYIKNHPNCGLQPIRKRINYNFQKSVETKYFNY